VHPSWKLLVISKYANFELYHDGIKVIGDVLADAFTSEIQEDAAILTRLKR
jgi:hypothetical protein